MARSIPETPDTQGKDEYSALVKILHLCDGIPPAVAGGAGRIAWDTALNLAARGHTVSFLTANHPSTPSSHDGIDIHTIPTRSLRWAHYRSVWSRKRAAEVLRVIDQCQVDVVHAHVIAWQCGYRWIREAHKRGVRIVVTCHDVMAIADGRIMPNDPAPWKTDLKRSRWQWNPFRTSIVRRWLNRYCTVVAVSEALADRLRMHGYTNVHVVHNGIDTTYWQDTVSRAEARRQVSLPEDACVFLLAGRLGIDKGTELVRTALPPQAHLLLAGPSDAGAFSVLKERVHVFPHQDTDGMRLLYRSANATLVPSRCLDCYPTVCLESMACATPVLATAWGGAREAVQDGHTGAVLDPLDVDAWQRTMNDVQKHPQEWESMGKAARTYAVEHCSIDTAVDQIESLYRTA